MSTLIIPCAGRSSRYPNLRPKWLLTHPDGDLMLEKVVDALTINGLDLVSALSAAATAISNVGPGLGDTIGPNGNFAEISNNSKWILSFAMILGRLELFAILVLFIPSFWRKF